MAQLDSEPKQVTQLLVARGITKTFDRTKALTGASVDVLEGEVHGLLGANGAGKSTLSKIIAGHYSLDSGELFLHGRPLRLRNTRDALRAGITIVMQETSLVPDLTVIENIFLPELAKPGRLDQASLRRRGREILESLGQADSLPFNLEVRRLSSAQKQLVEIAKALAVDARMLIFDEPTASLSPTEVERLFDIMERLRSQGCGLLFVSHRMEEVFSITDRVTIMREGKNVLSNQKTADITQAELIRAMVGTNLETIYSAPHWPADGTDSRPIALSVKGLSSASAVKEVSFEVHKGEILGLGGLVGAGRSETVEAIFGLRPRSSGQVLVNGQPLKANRPRDAIRMGVGFVAEDRRTQNIVPDLSVKENLLLAHLAAHRGFFRAYRAREHKIRDLLKMLDLPEERLADSSMLNFSGGMQQKIIIARWLVLEPGVLLLDEPTKGVDIGTRASIYSMLRGIADTGVAVVVVSSDFEEILGLCERIVVMSDGRSIADLPSSMLDVEKLTLLAAPRTSMGRTNAMLESLTSRYRAAGFWVLIEDDHLICLNSVVTEPSLDPGFRAGEMCALANTAIPKALNEKQAHFVAEANHQRTTLLTPIRSARGHDLGWIGLSLPPGQDLPQPDAITAEVNSTVSFT